MHTVVQVHLSASTSWKIPYDTLQGFRNFQGLSHNLHHSFVTWCFQPCFVKFSSGTQFKIHFIALWCRRKAGKLKYFAPIASGNDAGYLRKILAVRSGDADLKNSFISYSSVDKESVETRVDFPLSNLPCHNLFYRLENDKGCIWILRLFKLK